MAPTHRSDSIQGTAYIANDYIVLFLELDIFYDKIENVY